MDDPKDWDSEKTYGIEQITALITHFEVPLKATMFDWKAIFKEWRFFKNYMRTNHMGVESLQLWKNIFIHKRGIQKSVQISKYGSYFIKLKFIDGMGIQSVYSYYKNRHLCINHDTLQDLMSININDQLWTPQENERNFLIMLSKSFSQNHKQKGCQISHKTPTNPIRCRHWGFFW